MAKIDYDALADEFIRMVGQGSYQAGQRILKQAIEEGRRGTAVRKVATTPLAPKATAPLKTVRQIVAESVEELAKAERAKDPRLTIEQARERVYLARPELYEGYRIAVEKGEPPEWMQPAEAPDAPTGVAKIFHPGSAKARAWNAINDRATQIMEEELQRAHGAKSFSGITREQAILRAVQEDPGLYTAFTNASDEPVER